MKKFLLDIESEFELMVKYQTIVESKCTIVENAPNDEYQYSLYEISKPYPTYEEYLNGNDFDESELIMHSSNIIDIEKTQQIRRNIFVDEPVLA